MSRSKKTILESSGEVHHLPSEVYGTLGGPIAFRLGNGGAGPTGLLRAICEAFLSKHAPGYSIPWIFNHSRNTQLALFKGYVDVALTYERYWEGVAVEEGWAENGGLIAHDHFLIVGPASNPASLLPTDSIFESLSKIHSASSTFHSRSDGSATHTKELSLWSLLSLDATSFPPSSYKRLPNPPAEALIEADKDGAYTITDRATLLRQTAKETIKGIRVYYEPSSAEDEFMNSLAISFKPDEKKNGLVRKFVEWVKGEEGQRIIEKFGEDEAGVPLFAGLKDGYARTQLRGGRPLGGKWVPDV